MNRKRLILIFLLLLWMGVIFWFSTQSRTDSVELSGKLLRKLLAFSPNWDLLQKKVKTNVIDGAEVIL